jgi:hypothetical protein
MTTATADLTVPSTLSDEVQKVLRDSDTPLTLAELEGRLAPGKRAKTEVKNLVLDLVGQARLFKCSKVGRQDRYWGHDETERNRARLREKVKEFLAAGPRTITDIVSAVKGAVAGLKDKAIKDEVTAMQAAGHLHAQAGKPVRIGLEKPDPMASVSFSASVVKTLRTAFEKAEKAGASADLFFQRVRELVLTQTSPPAAAPRPAPEPVAVAPVHQPVAEPVPTPPAPEPPVSESDRELMDLVLKAVGENGPGVPMPVVDLRRQMPAEYRDKARLDRAVWKLVEQDKLYVVPHNYPAGLSDAERADLLTDPKGEYYAYVAQHG